MRPLLEVRQTLGGRLHVNFNVRMTATRLHTTRMRLTRRAGQHRLRIIIRRRRFVITRRLQGGPTIHYVNIRARQVRRRTGHNLNQTMIVRRPTVTTRPNRLLRRHQDGQLTTRGRHTQRLHTFTNRRHNGIQQRSFRTVGHLLPSRFNRRVTVLRLLITNRIRHHTIR